MYRAKWISPGENIECALDVRIAVFVEEQHFVDELDDIDKVAHHLVLFDDNAVPIGVGRVFEKPDDPETYIIGRVAVKWHMRKSGLGSVIMGHLEKCAAKLGAKQIVLGAQVHARPFYEKLGYTAFGSEYFEEDCPHIKMNKAI